MMSGLEPLIVIYCRHTFPFISDLRVKGLVTVTADNSAISYVDVDRTISHDEQRKLDVGPPNDLQLWQKTQNSEQMSWQNQRLKQQPCISPEKKSLPATVQSPSPQHLRMPQMPARVRMHAPLLMQSPRMSSVRMQQQPHVQQSVVRLKKIPSHLDASQGTSLAAMSAATLSLTHERLPVSRLSESEAKEAAKWAKIEDSSLAHSLGAAELYDQTSLPTAANKNKRKTGNQHNLLVSSGMDNGDSKEPWKKIPKLPVGQKGKKAPNKHSEDGQEEEEINEVEEIKNCKPNKPNVGNGDSKEPWIKIPKLPGGQKGKKILEEYSEEEQEEEEVSEEEEIMNRKPPRPNVGNGDSKEPWIKIPRLPGGQKGKKTLEEYSEEEQEEEEVSEEEEIMNRKPPRPNVGNGDSIKSRKKICKMTCVQKAKKALVEHQEDDEDKEEKKEEMDEDKEEKKEEMEEKNGEPDEGKMLTQMTASLQTATQDMETLADEHLATKASPRKRAKTVGLVDEAKMPRLEKEQDNPSFGTRLFPRELARSQLQGRPSHKHLVLGLSSLPSFL